MSQLAEQAVRHVTDQAGLEHLCAAARGHDWMGLDTEFIRERTYYPQLCLIQVSVPGLLATVDPLADLDLSPLDELLSDPGITKVLHASRQDFEVLYLGRGLVPTPVFDTQLAAALAGFGDQPGYAKLVEAMLGVRLEKGHTRTDWSQRPLTPEQMAYAIDDVRYLEALYQRLRDQLSDSGRLGWLAEDFSSLSDLSLYQVEPQDAWRRVKGSGRLRGDQVAALKALAEWRELTAQTADRPRGWIMKDDLVVELAKLRPQTLDALSRFRGIGDNLLRRSGDSIIECMTRTTTGDDLEDQRSRPLTAKEEDLLDLLQVATRLRARELGVSPQSLATRKDLTARLRGEPGNGLEHGWRHAALGETLDDVIAGRRVVRNGSNGPELIRAD
jgi:ribonuclease D